MKQNFTIRLLNKSELATAIDQFAKHVTYGDRGEAAEHFDEKINGPSDTFFASVEGEYAGSLTIRWESHNEQFRQNNIPFIHHLEVQAEFHGQGIANALMEEAEKLIGTRATHAGICVGIFAAYGSAQRLYAKRGYIPDGRGVCQHHRPVEEGETVTIDHDLMMWLVKAL